MDREGVRVGVLGLAELGGKHAGVGMPLLVCYRHRCLHCVFLALNPALHCVLHCATRGEVCFDCGFGLVGIYSMIAPRGFILFVVACNNEILCLVVIFSQHRGLYFTRQTDKSFFSSRYLLTRALFFLWRVLLQASGLTRHLDARFQFTSD